MRGGTALRWSALRSIGIGCWLACGPALAQVPPATPAAEVVHRVSFPALRQQYVEVTSEFPVAGAEAILLMPSWTPGAYRIQDFAANLDRIAVTGPGGTPLPVSKVAKDAWRVTLSGQRRISVHYAVHAGELNVAASYASPEFTLLNGASVFLYTEASRAAPQRVEVQPGPGQGEVLTPLAPAADGAGFIARDHDELIDSPIVVTDAAPALFQVDDHDYALVHVGEARLWDRQAVLDDVRAVISATNAFWGLIPFERRYWIFNLLVETGGGLEHDHGTVLMTSRWQTRKRSEYIKWLSLVAHEYFHAWNVRRLRPRSLARYAYRGEQYSGELWLAEGITSYYDDLLLSRARVVEPAEYLERLALQLHVLEMTPGRRNLSLEGASLDAWIRHYQPDANSINSTVSYYTKGAVLGFALDTRLRSASNGRTTLDEVMRRMYRRWGHEPYEREAFLQAVATEGGAAIADWLRPLLSTPRDPGIDEALDWYGLVLERKPGAATGEGLAATPPAAGFGINWSTEHAALVVGAVVHGLAAAEAGVLPGDELLAIDDERVTRDNLEDRKQRLRPGERVEFLLARNQRLLRLPVVLGEARPAHYEIKVRERFGRRELERMSDWLGQELAMPE